MLLVNRPLSLPGKSTPGGVRRWRCAHASQRQAARQPCLMEAVEARILLSTLNVLGNGVQITSGSTTAAAANLTDFGPTDVNHFSITETYTITDPDPVTALTLTGTTPVTIIGADAADFSVAAQPAADTLAANGGSTTFKISLDAQALGDRNATICIASNDTASSGNFTFAVEGHAMPAIELGTASSTAGVAIQSGGIPTTTNFTDFAYTDINDPTYALTRSYLLEDSSASAVNLTGSPLVTISGANAADFTVTAQPAIRTISSTIQAAFTITFEPQATGLRTATVSISNNGNTSPFTFNIQGTALPALQAASGYSTLYTTITQGLAGTASMTGDNIVVNYNGFLLDGTKFDSSLNPGRSPFSFLLGPDANNNGQDDVITGWEEGMLNLEVGEQRVLMIPAAEGYGAIGSPGAIPPNANLIFVVQRLQQIQMYSDPAGNGTNGTYIYAGATNPTTANETDFGLVAPGANVTHTFNITAAAYPPGISPGNAASSFQVTLSGADAAHFSTSGFQTGNTSQGNEYFYCTVTFTPGNTTGTQQATVNFDYNMISQANVTTPFAYTFTVQGTGQVQPIFSNLSTSSTIAYGAATVAFSGTITAGAYIPPDTESVAITLNGVTQDAPINSSGDFTSSFNPSALPASTTPYQVTYAYAGDANFKPVSDNTTTNLTVIPGTASIAGTIYGDTDDSGVWKAGDPELSDVMVYLDSNNSGQLDAGEISVYTDANGNYLFSDLAAGNYTVRQVAPGGYVQTYPASGYLDVAVTVGQPVTGNTFLDAPTGNATEVAVYRLYSPVTLEHLYTTDPREYDTLESYVGTWNGEGEVFSEYSGPATVGGVADEPFYRLYNPFVLQHLWTTDLNEYTVIATEGWEQEGIVGYVFPAAAGATATALPTVPNSQALYRLMAPQVHLWTTSLNEYDTLQTEGWTGEGIIGYVL